MATHNQRGDTLDSLRSEIKHLLAQEFSVQQIATELGVNVRSVQAHIAKYQLYDFVQPGKTKERWRKSCSKVKTLQFSDDEMALPEMQTAKWFQKLRSSGFHVEFSDVQGEVNMVFCKLKAEDKRPDEASFKTFFEFCLENHMKNWRKKMSNDLLCFVGEVTG